MFALIKTTFYSDRYYNFLLFGYLVCLFVCFPWINMTIQKEFCYNSGDIHENIIELKRFVELRHFIFDSAKEVHT